MSTSAWTDKRQAGHILAAPLLVDLQELGDLRGHGIRRLGGTADRTNPVPEFPCLDPPRFTQIDQFDPLATQVAHLLIADLEALAASIALAKPPQDRHRHREPQVLVLGDPALMGQVQVGQRQGVDGYAPGLPVGRITRMLRDVPLQRIDPQGTDASRLVSPQVIAGDVERSSVGIEPVAGDELPQGDDVAAGQVERPRTGLRGRHHAGPRRRCRPRTRRSRAGSPRPPALSACRSGGRR